MHCVRPVLEVGDEEGPRQEDVAGSLGPHQQPELFRYCITLDRERGRYATVLRVPMELFRKFRRNSADHAEPIEGDLRTAQGVNRDGGQSTRLPAVGRDGHLAQRCALERKPACCTKAPCGRVIEE